GRRAEGRRRAAVRRDAVLSRNRRAELQLLQLLRRRQLDLGAADEELVRDLARLAAASQEDEAVVVPSGCCPARARDRDEVRLAARAGPRRGRPRRPAGASTPAVAPAKRRPTRLAARARPATSRRLRRRP